MPKTKLGLLLFFLTTTTLFYPTGIKAQEDVINRERLLRDRANIETQGRLGERATHPADIRRPLRDKEATLPGRAVKHKAIVGRIVSHAHRMLNRAQHILKRLDHILGRVESRIKKFEAAGKDVTSLAPLVEDAKAKRGEVEAAIAKAKEMLTPVEKTNEPREQVEAFVNQMKDVRGALKSYRAAIVKIIRTMKGMSATTKVTPVATEAAQTGE